MDASGNQAKKKRGDQPATVGSFATSGPSLISETVPDGFLESSHVPALLQFVDFSPGRVPELPIASSTHRTSRRRGLEAQDCARDAFDVAIAIEGLKKRARAVLSIVKRLQKTYEPKPSFVGLFATDRFSSHETQPSKVSRFGMAPESMFPPCILQLSYFFRVVSIMIHDLLRGDGFVNFL